MLVLILCFKANKYDDDDDAVLLCTMEQSIDISCRPRAHTANLQ